MKQKFIDAYMDVASRFAELSSAKRLKVGAIIVKDDRIISIGYNGMPSGWSNDCEYTVEAHEEIDVDSRTIFYYPEETITKQEVIHAEANAIAKLAKSTESGKDAIMFLTHAPCIHCAKQIYTAGISKVFFKEHYRNKEGIDFLTKCGVLVDKYQKNL
jgi:dCMP deaminase